MEAALKQVPRQFFGGGGGDDEIEETCRRAQGLWILSVGIKPHDVKTFACG